MADKIIRGIAGNGQIRFFGVSCADTVRKAQEIHKLSITTSVLAGRLLAAGLMMGIDQKSSDEKLTIKITASGEVRSIIVTADNQGRVKCYLSNPSVELPLKENGTIDVGGLLGEGTLTVIKDMGTGQPYQGTIELQNGEIATDMSYYFSQSEQIPTAMGLGVLIEPEGEIRQAGGFLVQLMPDAEDKTIDVLERNLRELPNLTDLLDMGYEIEEVLEKLILMGLDQKILHTQSAEYYCDCSRERFLEGVKLLSKEELAESIEKSEDVVVQCHFCNTEYHYGKDELGAILASQDNQTEE